MSAIVTLNKLTATRFKEDMELRKHMFALARSGNKSAITWLWEKFTLRIIPKEENEEHVKNCKHCKSMVKGTFEPSSPLIPFIKGY